MKPIPYIQRRNEINGSLKIVTFILPLEQCMVNAITTAQLWDPLILGQHFPAEGCFSLKKLQEEKGSEMLRRYGYGLEYREVGKRTRQIEGRGCGQVKGREV